MSRCRSDFRFPIVLMAGLAGLPGCRDRPEPSRPRSASEAQRAEQTGWRRASAPASRPTTTRGASTASTGVAGSDREALPLMAVLSRAPVGQWARYRLAGGFEQRLVVLDRTDREVRLELTMWLDGEPAGLPTTRVEPVDVDWALRDAKRVKASIDVRQTTLTAARRQWSTRLTIARWRHEGVNYERRTWTSSDGPIYGTIRMLLTADDTLAASMALTAFGHAPADASPPQ